MRWAGYRSSRRSWRRLSSTVTMVLASARVAIVLGVLTLVCGPTSANATFVGTSAAHASRSKPAYRVVAHVRRQVVRRQGIIRIKGSVQPDAPKQPIVLQIRSRGHWHRLSRGSSSKHSTFSFAVHLRRLGRNVLRVVKPATRRRRAGTSHPVVVTVIIRRTVRSHGGRIRLHLGSVSVVAPRNSIRKGQTMTVQTAPMRSSPQHVASLAGGPYRISTSQGEPRRRVRIAFRYNPALLDHGDQPHVVHRSTRANGWVPLRTNVNSKRHVASATVGSFSLINVVDDSTRDASRSSPCYAAFPEAHSKTIGRTTWYNRQESVRMVLCYRFGLEPGADFPVSAGMVCGMLATVIGHGISENLGLFTTGACSGAEIASDPTEPTKYIGAACSWASALLKSVPAALGCTFAPSAGHWLGGMFESKHELDVAVDIVQHGKCIKYSPTHFGSSWLAVDCAPGDPGFANLPLAPTGSGNVGGSSPGSGSGSADEGGGAPSFPPPAEEEAPSGSSMSWSAIEAPVPAGGKPGDGRVFLQSACSSEGSCVLAGKYRDSGGEIENPMIETLENGIWKAIEPPVPAGGELDLGSWLGATATCSSADYCLLLGTGYYEPEYWRQAIYTLANGAWAPAPAPLPVGGDVLGGELDPGSGECASYVEVCAFLGEFQEEASIASMLATLSNGTWTATRLPVPVAAEAGSGSGLSGWGIGACSAHGTCIMPGEYRDGGGETHPMIETYDGSWAATALPVPAGGLAGSGSFFKELATGGMVNKEQMWCASGGTCVVPGRYSDVNGEEHQMIATLTDGSWHATDVPVPPGVDTGAGILTGPGLYIEEGPQGGAACSAADICVIPGSYDGDRSHGMIAILADGVWTAVKAPTPVGSESEAAYVDRSGCSPNGTCVLVGEYWGSASGEWHVMLDTLLSGSWTSVRLPLPAGARAGSGEIEGSPVCSASGTCVVIGKYRDSSDEEHGMIDTLVNGSWSSIAVPVPAGAEAGSGFAPFSHVACALLKGSCVVPGVYRDSDGESHSMVVVGEAQ